MAPSGSQALLFDVHYDGVLFFAPLRYEHSLTLQLRVSNDNRLGYASLSEHLRERTQQNLYAMFYQILKCDLEKGLSIIETDFDVYSMYDFCETYGKMNVYLVHIPHSLAEFYHKNLLLIDWDVETTRLMSHEKKKKNVGKMFYDELVSWAEKEAENMYSPPIKPINASVHKAIESGKGKVDKGKRIMMKDTNVLPNKVDNVRGGRGRGGGVVRGKGDAVKGGRGIGKGRGWVFETSRATTVGGIDTVRCEPIRGATSCGLSNLGVKRKLFEANAGSNKPGKTLGLRVRRGIGKRNVVAENVRYNMLGKWFGINESNPTPSEDNGIEQTKTNVADVIHPT
ncbi:hypothetical protein Tco_1058485 [Tanacetum coccineum]|uniref:Uncharacterized protein n=1 Tax=Tanacetum coccineum TaxID=301880 RepID=A0ABQ5HAF0_9ASTR